MGDETADSMNLDLNLSPSPEAPLTNVPIEVETWDDEHLRRMREAVRVGAPQRFRWHRFQLIRNSEAGEGSDENKNKQNGTENGFRKLEEGLKDEERNEAEKKKKNGLGGEENFFDCNICLDLAKNPVVTCCGHLFCWACLYRWLHFHSDAKECPVCKGEVTFKTVTPIYGRGGTHTRHSSGEEEEEEGKEEEESESRKIPDRPQARRVESIRQTIQRNMLSLPMDEMIRRLGTRFDLFAPNQERDREDHISNPMLESAERTNTLLTRILSARGLRREHNPAEEEEGRRSQFRRNSPANHHHHHQNGRFPAPFVDTFRPVNSPAGDDRDSFSSIAAVINSESQVDNAGEIDSHVSASSRRSSASRASDLDTGDSRAPRRRRVN